MTDSNNKAGSKALAAGVLVVVALAIVGAGVWFVLGPGSGSGAEEAQASQNPANEATPAHAIEAALGAAASYRSSEEFAKAEAVLRAAVEEHVEDQGLRLAYAEVLMDLQKTEQAYEQYEAALAIGPRDPQIEFNAGTLAMAVGNRERALEHYSMARTAEPGNAQIALYLGAVQHQLGMQSEAKASLLAAIQLDESSAEASSMLAQIYLDENDGEVALSFIRKARQAEPAQVAHRILEARILRRLNKPDEALTLLMALPEGDLYQPMVLELCSASMGLLNQRAEAAGLYERAMELNPGEPEYAFQAAQWHERAGNTERAAELARRASMMGHEQAKKMADRLAEG